MMFLGFAVLGTCLVGDGMCTVSWPAAKVAEVTASPERKSLRFISPRLSRDENEEG